MRKLMVLLFAMSAIQASAIVFVDPTASGASDGTSWGDAYTNLVVALSASSTTSEMHIAEGVYIPGGDVNDSFFTDGQTLRGGFPSGGGSYDPAANVTVFEGSGYIRNVVEKSSTVTNKLWGIKIRGGFNSASIHGAGVRVLDGAIELYDCNISSNSLTGGGWGAGLYVDSGAVNAGFYASNTVFSSNSIAAGRGGSVSINTPASMTRCELVDCTFTDNYAGGSSYGGAAFLSQRTGCDSIFRSCIFSNNVSDEHGGAVVIGSGIVPHAGASFFDCTFTTNRCLGGDDDGGAFFSDADDSLFFWTNCLFTDNWAGRNGGSIYQALSIYTTNTLINCVFSNGVADNAGQLHLWAHDGIINLADCDFVGGVATVGDAGGVRLRGRDYVATITDCDWLSCHADGDGRGGGGLAIYGGQAITLSGSSFLSCSTAGGGGGAMTIENVDGSFPTMTITNCQYIQNISTNGNGGAIRCVNSVDDPTDFFHIFGSSFVSNAILTGTGDGGAIHIRNSGTAATNRFVNSTFAYNSTPGDAGAMTMFDSHLCIHSGCVYSNNTAGLRGGAIYYQGAAGAGDLIVSNTVLFGNQSTTDEGAHAFLNSTASDINFVDCDFLEGSAELGAVVTRNTSTDTYTRCLFSSNSTLVSGSAVWGRDALLKCIDSTFIGNASAGDAGAVDLHNAGSFLLGCSFDTNTSDGAASSVYCDDVDGLSVTNCSFRNGGGRDISTDKNIASTYHSVRGTNVTVRREGSDNSADVTTVSGTGSMAESLTFAGGDGAGGLGHGLFAAAGPYVAPGARNVIFDPYSVTAINGSRVFARYQDIYMQTNITDSATLEMNSDNIVRRFFLDSLQAVGTWGSSSSAATNQDDALFAGAFVLDVWGIPTKALVPSGANRAVRIGTKLFILPQR